MERRRKKETSSPTYEISFGRKAKPHHTVHSPLRKRSKVQNIDFTPPSVKLRSTSNVGVNINNNNNCENSSNNQNQSNDGERLIPAKRTNSQETHSFNIYEDILTLSNIRDEDIDKIMPYFAPLPKKNVSKMQEKFSYLSEFLEEKYLENVISSPILKLKGGNAVSTLKGPNHSSVELQEFGEHISCRSISTYPQLEGFHTREGDPICDRYFVKLFENRIIASLSDGCAWGERSRKASKKACKASTLYLTNKQKEFKTLRDFAKGIMESIADAHAQILKGHSKDTLWEAGSTTILNCNLLELDVDSQENDSQPILLDNGKKAPWVLIGGSVGDSKVLLYSSETKKIVDLTSETKRDLFGQDSGGKIGSVGGLGKPDLRNYSVFFKGCQENDIVLLLTDGLFDNFDPIKTGKSPADFGINCLKWEDLDFGVAQKISCDHIVKYVEEVVNSSESLGDICNKLVSQCSKTTDKIRKFTEDHPTEKLPSDPNLFPGTLGHATVVAIRVGDVTLSYNKWMGKNEPKVP